ncbi:protein FimG-like protein [Escherichia coli]|nr:protein FimG-like protein [Escherichia coli]STK37253.1 protein FimG-like protein [Escherichia coli]STQ57505.1 protein FimG-like protein [Escherichia coli]
MGDSVTPEILSNMIRQYFSQERPEEDGFAPIFPDICYHLTHYKPAAADIPVASDNPAHYADAIRYNARTPLQGSLLPLTRLVWA